MKIYLQQVIVPDYRIKFFQLLKQHFKDFNLVAGDSNFNSTPKTEPMAWNFCEKSKQVFFLNQKLLFQYGSLKKMLFADALILNANLRIISNWLLLLIRKLFFKKTILWGHAIGKKNVPNIIKNFYLTLSNGFICYTEKDLLFMQNKFPKIKLWVAPNACLNKEECHPCQLEISAINSIIYVGRLIKAKKVDVLIRALKNAIDKKFLSNEVRLLIVGDGIERNNLIELVKELNLMDRVTFKGHIQETSVLRKLYGSSFCSVSSGYVGLSATQSFSFGIPMVVSKNESHSPEIEACQEGFNAKYFETDDVNDLALKLLEFYKERESFFESRNQISENAARNYSFEAMRDTFVRVIDDTWGKD